MDVSEKLVELLQDCLCNYVSMESYDWWVTYEVKYKELADNLIANGVTVQECKAGDVVYQTDGVRVYESTVKNVLYDVGHFAFDKDAIGKSVFLTRKEAEAHLPQPQKGE